MPNEDLVHIIDDDEAVRESVAFLLDSAGIASRAYSSAEQFLSAFSTESTGCIVTDVRMPGTTGIDLLRRLAEIGSTVPAIVITGHADVPLAVEAMRLGAVDFLEKPFDDETLIASIRTALTRARQGDQTEAERAAASSRLATLSPRERDVLEGLVAGKPNKMIAFDLGISARTVEVYRANVMTKTQAASLSELVRMALIASGFRAGS
jgi:two-component system response regulator FixJ